MFPPARAQTIPPFFFNDTAPTAIYTLSLHDALPICRVGRDGPVSGRIMHVRHPRRVVRYRRHLVFPVENFFSHFRTVEARLSISKVLSMLAFRTARSEEHTSELQSLRHLVCRLLLEK